jgi:hypothetical protein
LLTLSLCDRERTLNTASMSGPIAGHGSRSVRAFRFDGGIS